MSEKKPAPIFEVRFPGIYPWRISTGKISRMLSAVTRLAAGEVAGDEDEEDDEDKSQKPEAVRLLDVVKGSAVYRFVGADPSTTLARLRETGDMLRNPEEASDNEYALRPIKDLSAISEALSCPIELKEPGPNGAVLAYIKGDSYIVVSKSLLLSGDTSLVGKVMRVGGATETRCGLRVSFQSRMLFCRVASADIARQLGELLYQRVVVHGTARWLRKSMRVFSFMIRDAYQPKADTITNSLKAVWEAGLDEWQKIDDPDAFLQEIRGEE